MGQTTRRPRPTRPRPTRRQPPAALPSSASSQSPPPPPPPSSSPSWRSRKRVRGDDGGVGGCHTGACGDRGAVRRIDDRGVTFAGNGGGRRGGGYYHDGRIRGRVSDDDEEEEGGGVEVDNGGAYESSPPRLPDHWELDVGDDDTDDDDDDDGAGDDEVERIVVCNECAGAFLLAEEDDDPSSSRAARNLRSRLRRLSGVHGEGRGEGGGRGGVMTGATGAAGAAAAVEFWHLPTCANAAEHVGEVSVLHALARQTADRRSREEDDLELRLVEELEEQEQTTHDKGGGGGDDVVDGDGDGDGLDDDNLLLTTTTSSSSLPSWGEIKDRRRKRGAGKARPRPAKRPRKRKRPASASSLLTWSELGYDHRRLEDDDDDEGHDDDHHACCRWRDEARALRDVAFPVDPYVTQSHVDEVLLRLRNYSHLLHDDDTDRDDNRSILGGGDGDGSHPPSGVASAIEVARNATSSSPSPHVRAQVEGLRDRLDALTRAFHLAKFGRSVFGGDADHDLSEASTSTTPGAPGTLATLAGRCGPICLGRALALDHAPAVVARVREREWRERERLIDAEVEAEVEAEAEAEAEAKAAAGSPKSDLGSELDGGGGGRECTDEHGEKGESQGEGEDERGSSMPTTPPPPPPPAESSRSPPPPPPPPPPRRDDVDDGGIIAAGEQHDGTTIEDGGGGGGDGGNGDAGRRVASVLSAVPPQPTTTRPSSSEGDDADDDAGTTSEGGGGDVVVSRRPSAEEAEKVGRPHSDLVDVAGEGEVDDGDGFGGSPPAPTPTPPPRDGQAGSDGDDENVVGSSSPPPPRRDDDRTTDVEDGDVSGAADGGDRGTGGAADGDVSSSPAPASDHSASNNSAAAPSRDEGVDEDDDGGGVSKRGRGGGPAKVEVGPRAVFEGEHDGRDGGGERGRGRGPASEGEGGLPSTTPRRAGRGGSSDDYHHSTSSSPPPPGHRNKGSAADDRTSDGDGADEGQGERSGGAEEELVVAAASSSPSSPPSSPREGFNGADGGTAEREEEGDASSPPPTEARCGPRSADAGATRAMFVGCENEGGSSASARRRDEQCSDYGGGGVGGSSSHSPRKEEDVDGTADEKVGGDGIVEGGDEGAKEGVVVEGHGGGIGIDADADDGPSAGGYHDDDERAASPPPAEEDRGRKSGGDGSDTDDVEMMNGGDDGRLTDTDHRPIPPPPGASGRRRRRDDENSPTTNVHFDAERVEVGVANGGGAVGGGGAPTAAAATRSPPGDVILVDRREGPKNGDDEAAADDAETVPGAPVGAGAGAVPSEGAPTGAGSDGGEDASGIVGVDAVAVAVARSTDGGTRIVEKSGCRAEEEHAPPPPSGGRGGGGTTRGDDEDDDDDDDDGGAAGGDDGGGAEVVASSSPPRSRPTTTIHSVENRGDADATDHLDVGEEHAAVTSARRRTDSGVLTRRDDAAGDAEESGAASSPREGTTAEDIDDEVVTRDREDKCATFSPTPPPRPDGRSVVVGVVAPRSPRTEDGGITAATMRADDVDVAAYDTTEKVANSSTLPNHGDLVDGVAKTTDGGHATSVRRPDEDPPGNLGVTRIDATGSDKGGDATSSSLEAVAAVAECLSRVVFMVERGGRAQDWTFSSVDDDASSSPSSTTTPPPPLPPPMTGEYDVVLPMMGEGGLMLKVRDCHGFVTFRGYRRLGPNRDVVGPAERQRLVRTVGDKIIAINGRSVVHRTFNDTIVELKRVSGGDANYVYLRFLGESVDYFGDNALSSVGRDFGYIREDFARRLRLSRRRVLLAAATRDGNEGKKHDGIGDGGARSLRLSDGRPRRRGRGRDDLSATAEKKKESTRSLCVRLLDVDVGYSSDEGGCFDFDDDTAECDRAYFIDGVDGTFSTEVEAAAASTSTVCRHQNDDAEYDSEGCRGSREDDADDDDLPVKESEFARGPGKHSLLCAATILTRREPPKWELSWGGGRKPSRRLSHGGKKSLASVPKCKVEAEKVKDENAEGSTQGINDTRAEASRCKFLVSQARRGWLNPNDVRFYIATPAGIYSDNGNYTGGAGDGDDVRSGGVEPFLQKKHWVPFK